MRQLKFNECAYEDEWTQIWWGDALNLSFIADNSVDLIITSPPYNIGPKEGGRILWKGVRYGKNKDKKPEEEYQSEQIVALGEMWRVARPGASLFYNHKIRNRGGRGIHPLLWIAKTEWVFRQEIIWDRGSTHNHEMTYFWPINELVFWLTKGVKNVHVTPEGAELTTVWRFPFQVRSEHPAPFPEELVWRCIKAASKAGDVVLDPYVGSMTTCRVAKKMRRRSIGVDITREYIEQFVPTLRQDVLPGM